MLNHISPLGMEFTREEQQKTALEKIRAEEQENRARLEAVKHSLPYINLTFIPIDPDALSLITLSETQAGELAVINTEGKTLRIAVLNPENSKTKEIIANLSKNWQVKVFLTSLISLKKAWALYPKETQAKEITGEISISNETIEGFKKELANLQILKTAIEKLTKTSATQLVEAILGGAITLLASDVHFEPEKNQVRIRIRIDGLLEDVTTLALETYRFILDRIKLLSGLKLNISDTAQDGRFTITSAQEQIEIRTSVLPGPWGENIVIRVLNPALINLELPALGFRKDDLEILEKELSKPTGMILTTGPTGSGKSTTLYAFTKKILTPEIKIITIEDPIEYHINGISQTQVDPEEGYTFANGLRSIVRQDPDVILVGEIRDLETAETALHAALTGHLVFSTLHTNDAFGIVPRLIDLGVKPVIIAPAINVAMAQRLLRRVCQKCANPRKITEQELKILKNYLENLPSRAELPQNLNPDTAVMEAKGCPECHQGYKGRIAVLEILQIDDELERLITASPAEAEIRNLALKKGLVTMQQDALIKILAGLTTFGEAQKILGNFTI